MLKVRVLSGIVGLILLGAIVYSGEAVLGVAVFALSVIGLWEFYRAVTNAGYKPVSIIGYMSCLPVLLIGLNANVKLISSHLDILKSMNYFSMGLFAVIVILFCFIIFQHDKYNITDISLTLFGVFYISFLFLFIVLTRNMKDGFYLIWLIFIGAFATDTFAYFSGLLFGRNKLLPAISPKKTVEGSIGGIIGCVLVTLLYGYYLNYYVFHEIYISLYHFVILGVLNGMISQIGDWSASAVKRYVKIKDYGDLMPGHGGVLDRFDSILFVAPVVYFYMSFLIK